MKQKFRNALFVLFCLTIAIISTGCGTEATPYETNDAENYTVSVKYDANGGSFTTNTSVIVDSYNISDMDKNANGNVELALLTPDNSLRGNDAFTAVNNGYFLAGWYKNRTEISNNDGKAVYSYSEKWDFEKGRLEIDPSKTYSSTEPVVTLYAAWVPLFEIQFYSVGSDEMLSSITFDPTNASEIKIPDWNKETGLMEMYRFPKKTGYTFDKVFYDKEGTKPLETETVEHTGVVDYETGTAKDSVMKLYIQWTEGEWYHIYTAEQFSENANVNGNYEIFADLDFEGEIWPTAFIYGNFNGTINGNGYTMKNISVVQTNNSKVNAGLFGNMAETAKISDLTFQDVTVTIKAGTRVTGTRYGLFAGTISEKAQIEGVKILNGTLEIDSSCYFGTDDYSIGLVCGNGNSTVVEIAEIQCVAVGDKPETVNITLNGNNVILEFITE